MTKNRKKQEYFLKKPSKSQGRFWFWLISLLIISCLASIALPNLLGGGWLSFLSGNAVRLRAVNRLQQWFYVENQKFASGKELEEFAEYGHIFSSTSGVNKYYTLKIITQGNTTITLAQRQDTVSADFKRPDFIAGLQYHPESKRFTSITCVVKQDVPELKIFDPRRAIIFDESEVKCGRDVEELNDSKLERYLK